MKKFTVIALGTVLLCSSCGTYTGSGAYTGASIGSILGSAIGGISGGPRGSDIGTLVGMAGGAVIGGAIGQQADKAKKQEMHDRYQQIQQRKAQQQDQYEQSSSQNYNYQSGGDDESGFDPNNGGDDRIYDFNGTDYTGTYSASKPISSVPATSSVDDLVANYTFNPAIEIVNARFVDENKDNALNRGELCKVIFEVKNNAKETLHDVVPTVVESTGNTHIYISPSVHVESIAPGKGIRYTAMVKADNRLKDGSARICLSVLQGGKAISKVTEFNIPTTKQTIKQ